MSRFIAAVVALAAACTNTPTAECELSPGQYTQTVTIRGTCGTPPQQTETVHVAEHVPLNPIVALPAQCTPDSEDAIHGCTHAASGSCTLPSGQSMDVSATWTAYSDYATAQWDIVHYDRFGGVECVSMHTITLERAR